MNSRGENVVVISDEEFLSRGQLRKRISIVIDVTADPCRTGWFERRLKSIGNDLEEKLYALKALLGDAKDIEIKLVAKEPAYFVDRILR